MFRMTPLVRAGALAPGLALGLAVGAPATAQAPATGPSPTAPVQAATITPGSSANVNISPKRVTFDRNHRSATVFIYNQGTATGTFDITLVDRIMAPNGRLLTVEEAQANAETKALAERLKSAAAILQAAPRRVTLDPGQGQTIRLRVVGVPDGAEAAEYRSHLTVATLPSREAGATAEEAAAAPSVQGMSFRITALFGVSIPAIVRLNEPDVRAAIENPRLTFEQLNPDPKAATPKSPVLNLDLVRLGANSLFGNVEVRVAGPKGAALGQALGVGVYTEIDRRKVQVVLSRPPAPGEHLEIIYTDDDTSPGKLLAKTTL